MQCYLSYVNKQTNQAKQYWKSTNQIPTHSHISYMKSTNYIPTHSHPNYIESTTQSMTLTLATRNPLITFQHTVTLAI